jgi:hypothetical protein
LLNKLGRVKPFCYGEVPSSTEQRTIPDTQLRLGVSEDVASVVLLDAIIFIISSEFIFG